MQNRPKSKGPPLPTSSRHSDQMAAILEQGLAEGFDGLREAQIAHIRKRDEVLK